MSKPLLLIGVATISIAASTAFTVAQTSRPESGSATAQSQPSPAGSSMSSEESTGQAPGLEKRGSAPSGAGQGSERAQERRAGETKDSQPRTGQTDQKSTGQDAKPDQRTGQEKQPATGQKQDTQRTKTDSSKTGSDAKSGSASGAADTKASSAEVNVTSEQQTKIRTVVQKVNIKEVNNVNVNVSIGTALPATVELVPIPTEIIEIVPQFRGYRVIKIGGRILIIEPSSRKIVYIITG